jgi:hypothetical protein
MSDNGSSELPGKKVSYNSRSVLLALFTLVGFTLAVYTYSVNVFPLEQSGRLNTVFIAAISGTLALGGTLISQLWGTSTKPAAPSIYLTDPVDTAAEVPLNTSISAFFDMLIDEETVNPNTFTLKDDTSDIEGTVTLEGGRAILKPSGDLKPGTTYTATITTDVKSIAGESLEKNKVWSFTTKSGS